MSAITITAATELRTLELYSPSPPYSSKNSETNSENLSDSSLGIEEEEEYVDIPLPSDTNSAQTVGKLKVLDIDLSTPDFHVPRDPRLIRLTGVHPFNSEASLTTLFDSGFLTPSSLFYVRNHGAVPQIPTPSIQTWTITITGLVRKPLILKLSQLQEEFPQVTLPITLVCAGNRRKEQNVVRKSQGFSWGSGGASNSLFTGPLLREVLGAVRVLGRARYVCFEGADELPNGKYGTSLKLSQVMDPDRGIMLAHKQNGEPLTPDHGRPIRLVVPSMIGGRSVKWLKKITLTEGPSENWYHIYDNRVLPTMITPEISKNNLKLWIDERYAIYDLSVNSVIVYPSHNETILSNSAQKTYNLRGYAYAGGGRRVTRVELSFDKGRTWELAEISYPEDLYRSMRQKTLYGGHLNAWSSDCCFCWCFWEAGVSVSRLRGAEDIVVRAMDEAMNIQPRDMYWNVLGMMNNSWFRVAIRRDEDGRIWFEHPTQPGLQAGGWMDRVKKAGGDLMDKNWGDSDFIPGAQEQEGGGGGVVKELDEEIKLTRSSVNRTIEIAELRYRDNAKQEPWFVINGSVYDGTGFLEQHPGGAISILAAAGLDATDEFMAIHSETAKAMMPKYHVGTLSESSRLALLNENEAMNMNTSEIAESKVGDYFLNNQVWKKSTLVAKRSVSWDTRIFTFSLDSPTQSLGLPVGQHILLKVQADATENEISSNSSTPSSSTRESIIRAYTPISKDSPTGVVDLLIKLYFRDPSSHSSAGGKMTMALDALPIGHRVFFKGPIGKFKYIAPGEVSINDTERTIGCLLMICAGSGVTPIFQVLQAVMENSEDKTRCVVVDGNREVGDVLCKEELDSFARRFPEKLKLVYTLTKQTPAWKGLTGRINAELIEQYLPLNQQQEFEKKSLILVCGPEALEKFVRGVLKKNSWSDDDTVFF